MTKHTAIQAFDTAMVKLTAQAATQAKSADMHPDSATLEKERRAV